MTRRALGNTGLTLPAIGFGAAPLGGVYGSITQDQADRTVRAALDAGINFFDVSPYYGNAEEVLGRALKGIPRDRYTLGTKLGRYGPRDFDFSPARAKTSITESLAKFGTDYLDIILCHDIEFVDRGPVIEETIPALRAEQAAGKVRLVGVSGLPLSIFPEVLDKTDLDVILSYCHNSLNDDSLLDLLPLLEPRGVGIIGASPLSMGLLTGNALPEWHPAPVELREAVARAAAHCQTRGKSLATLALQFALNLPGPATMLIGMASEEQVAQNIAALEVPLDEELTSEVQAILMPIHRMTWSTGLVA